MKTNVNVKTSNVIQFSAVAKARFIYRDMHKSADEDTTSIEYSYRIPNDRVIDYPIEQSITFSDIKVLTYFIHDNAKSDENIPNGIFMKTSKTHAILIIDGFETNIPEFEDVDQDYPAEGSSHRFTKDVLIKALHCDINLRG